MFSLGVCVLGTLGALAVCLVSRPADGSAGEGEGGSSTAIGDKTWNRGVSLWRLCLCVLADGLTTPFRPRRVEAWALDHCSRGVMRAVSVRECVDNSYR